MSVVYQNVNGLQTARSIFHNILRCFKHVSSLVKHQVVRMTPRECLRDLAAVPK